MERMGAKIKKITLVTAVATNINYYGKLLRPLASCHHKFAGLHYLCFQLYQAENIERLAVIWRILGVPCRPVYRDVWFSADDISFFRMAFFKISWH